MSEVRRYIYLFVFLIGISFTYSHLTYAEIPDQWLGKYEVSDVEKENASRLTMAINDLNLRLIRTRLGFDARWIKFEGNYDNKILESESRSNSYLERGQKNVFFTPSSGKIYAGEEFSWAQLTDKGLVLYAINTDPHGRYMLTTYYLTHQGKNRFKFHLNVIVENENYGDVKGTLVKKKR